MKGRGDSVESVLGFFTVAFYIKEFENETSPDRSF